MRKGDGVGARSVLQRLFSPLTREVQALNRRVDDLDRRLQAMDIGIHEQLGAIRDDIRLQTERLRIENDALRAQLDTVPASLEARARDLSEAVRIHAQRHAEEVGALSVERSTARIGRLERLVRNLDLQSTVADARPAATPSPAETGLAAALDPVSYGAFEEEMRGPSSVVRELQREYLPDICSLPHPELPVLDVGCGRGEFLALLREAGAIPEGLDINPDFVEECKEAGFRVELGDATEQLASRPEASLRAITSFHVVEHLPMAVLTRFLGAAHRAVAPGGGVLLETPDPANLAVGAHRFWFDPTHLRPLPSALLSFLVRDAGFDQVEIRRLHPLPQAVSADSSDPAVAGLIDVVNEALTGPVDYLLLARRP